MLREIESGYVKDTTCVDDTGATSQYLTDTTPITSEITMRNDNRFQCTEKGIYRAFFKKKHGIDVPIVMQDVLHAPWLAVHYKTRSSILS
jgi:hypothetical protein